MSLQLVDKGPTDITLSAIQPVEAAVRSAPLPSIKLKESIPSHKPSSGFLSLIPKFLKQLVSSQITFQEPSTIEVISSLSCKPDRNVKLTRCGIKLTCANAKAGFYNVKQSGTASLHNDQTKKVQSTGKSANVEIAGRDFSLNVLSGSENKDPETYQVGEWTIQETTTSNYANKLQASLLIPNAEKTKACQGNIEIFAGKEETHSSQVRYKTDGTSICRRENLPCSILMEVYDPNIDLARSSGAKRTEYVFKQSTVKDDVQDNKLNAIDSYMHKTTFETGQGHETNKIQYLTRVENELVVNRYDTTDIRTEFTDISSKESTGHLVDIDEYGSICRSRTVDLMPKKLYEPGKERTEKIISREHCKYTEMKTCNQTPVKTTVIQSNNNEHIRYETYEILDCDKETTLPVENKDPVTTSSYIRTACGIKTVRRIEKTKNTSHGVLKLLDSRKTIYVNKKEKFRETSDIKAGHGMDAVTTNPERVVEDPHELSYIVEDNKSGYFTDTIIRKNYVQTDRGIKQTNETVVKSVSAGVKRSIATLAGGITSLVIKGAIERQDIRTDLVNVGVSTVESFSVGTLAAHASRSGHYTRSMVGLGIVSTIANAARILSNDKADRTIGKVISDVAFDVAPAAIQILSAAKNIKAAGPICTFASVATDAVRTTRDYFKGRLTGKGLTVKELIAENLRGALATGVSIGASILTDKLLVAAAVTSTAATYIVPAVVATAAVYCTVKIFNRIYHSIKNRN